jgi:RecB family exonuclease
MARSEKPESKRPRGGVPENEAQTRDLVLGDYPVLETAFFDTVRELKKSDPLAPLIVLVPSHLLGIHLSRFLAENDFPHINIRFWTLKDFAERAGMPVLFAEDRMPAAALLLKELVAGICEDLAAKEKGFYFKAIADKSGFHDAIISTIKDLKRACLTPKDLGGLIKKPGLKKTVYLKKVEDVLKIWRAYEKRMEDLGWYDEPDSFLVACEGVADTKLVQQSRAVLIYGFYDLNEVQKRLVKACLDLKPMTAFVPFEDQRAFGFVEPIIEWFRAEGFVDATPLAAPVGGPDVTPAAAASAEPAIAPKEPRSIPLDDLCSRLFAGNTSGNGDGGGQPGTERTGGDTETTGGESGASKASSKDSAAAPRTIEDSLTIISAPGEVREVREIARFIAKEVLERGTPIWQIGILTRHSHPYTSLLRDILGSLGLHPYILEGLELKATRPGRTLCLLLEILRHDFARHAVMEFATYARLDLKKFYPKGVDPDPVTLWDIVTMDAGIVEGKEEWEEHLPALLAELKMPGARPKPYTTGTIEALIKFSKHLIKSLAAVEKAPTWTDVVAALIDAYTSLIEPDTTEEAAKDTLEVLKAVKQIRKLDELAQPGQSGTKPSVSDLLELVDDILTDETRTEGRFQRNGPEVVSLIAARGIPFKTVIIPGMVEKSFPAPARQDAILLDAERAAINRELSGSDSGPIDLKGAPQLDQERLFYRLAIGAARERLVLTFPRLTIGTARERVPSSFVLATIEAATGSRVDFETVESFPGLRRIPLSQIGAEDPASALDEVEFDIALVSKDIAAGRPDGLSYLQATSPFLTRALDLELSRWGKRAFTPYDGIVAGKQSRKHLKDKYSIVGKSVGPTRLETYATCPYRYYLSNILRLEALVEPEHVETIDALDRGSLIHSILWEFFHSLKKRAKNKVPVAIKESDFDVLVKVAEDRFAHFEKLGRTGYPILWEMEKDEIRVHLEGVFHEQLAEAGPEGSGFLPAYFEVRYGMASRDSEESDISTEEPVAVPFGGREISLRGKIDRIDMTPGLKRARVIDYKTGKSKPKKKDNDFGEGTALQLPLYLRAAYALLNRIHGEVDLDYAEYYNTGITGKKRHIKFDYSELLARKAELTGILDTIADGIEAGNFFAYPGDQCTWCDFTPICGTAGQRLTIYDRKSGDKRIKAFRKMKGEDEEKAEEKAKEGGKESGKKGDGESGSHKKSAARDDEGNK